MVNEDGRSLELELEIRKVRRRPLLPLAVAVVRATKPGSFAIARVAGVRRPERRHARRAHPRDLVLEGGPRWQCR
jgi:hypothetical protein